MKADADTTGIAKAGTLDSWWQLQGDWVEPPNERRGGSSGVQRIRDAQGRLLYAKRQTGHIYRSLRHPFGRPTVLRERDALLGARQAGVRVPEIVFCEAEQDHAGWRALLVTAALEGFQPIEDWYVEGSRERHGERLHGELLEQVAKNLAQLHRARWQHSCIYIKHIFVRVSGEGEAARAEAALIDLEKCRQRLTSAQAALHDMHQLRRHSSWNDSDWHLLIDAYRAAYGRPLKGLPA
ncbi:lipopolysaccharide kinase InaA family protein [Pseudomonas benzenivorans]|uniref:InaA protein n=1 Tax=Pseudomonas benzenivorans TaxID=556533 RepID=A0ABY5H4P8_9PSED|nr:lipopolysaccharide kinase InaA family protein [Pseudomonas benzenivorans]UTW06832.1 InaA protein [Pseudomonas benzenivorans]